MKIAVALTLAALLLGQDQERKQDPQREHPRADQATVDRILQTWPAEPKETGTKLIAKYGLPHGAMPDVLVWHDTGPWKLTILYREMIQHDFPKPHKDYLMQMIDYRVPPDKFDDLAMYDGSVVAERTAGTLAARCHMEEANYLAINLSVDIVNGKRDVQDAREFYGQMIQELMAGKKPEYTQKFVFEMPKEPTGDPDRAILPEK